jgi:hypothetical protein
VNKDILDESVQEIKKEEAKINSSDIKPKPPQNEKSNKRGKSTNKKSGSISIKRVSSDHQEISLPNEARNSKKDNKIIEEEEKQVVLKNQPEIEVHP